MYSAWILFKRLCFRLYCRLYLYPIKVLYSTGYHGRPFVPTAPFYFFFNSMLWMLFFMNLYWFQFIVWLIIRIMFGKSRGVEDTREIPKESGKKRAVSDKAVNGNVGKPGELSVSNGANHGKAGIQCCLFYGQTTSLLKCFLFSNNHYSYIINGHRIIISEGMYLWQIQNSQ